MQTDDPLAWAEDRIRALTSGRTLDIGCGEGRFLARGIVGLDVDHDRLRTARGRSRSLVRGDAHALPFREGAFETAYANRVLNDAGRIDEVLAEIGRVLRPDGRLLVFTRARPAEGDRLDRSNGQARLAAHFERVSAELHPTNERAAVFVASRPRGGRRAARD
jgi:ubiquinone/menaquinone biosynthesis C-methylase UbiE